jgi:hypothetical protein
MLAPRSPRLAGLAFTGALVATPALTGLVAAATPTGAAGGTDTVAIVAAPAPGPAVGLDRNGIGLGDLTADPRSLTSGVGDLGVSDGTSVIRPVQVAGAVAQRSLDAVGATVARVAPVTARN